MVARPAKKHGVVVVDPKCPRTLTPDPLQVRFLLYRIPIHDYAFEVSNDAQLEPAETALATPEAQDKVQLFLVELIVVGPAVFVVEGSHLFAGEDLVEGGDGEAFAELCLGADLQGKFSAPLLLAACELHGVIADGRVVALGLVSSAGSSDDMVLGLCVLLHVLPGGLAVVLVAYPRHVDLDWGG